MLIETTYAIQVVIILLKYKLLALAFSSFYYTFL